MARGAAKAAISYHANMARKTKQVTISAPQPDWYLQEWMKTLDISQAKLAHECDWTRGTMHGIYHGRTAYYRELVNLIAGKLHIRPYELLMHPDEAMALRRFREQAVQVVKTAEGPERTGTTG